jgi:hypothetical protein
MQSTILQTVIGNGSNMNTNIDKEKLLLIVLLTLSVTIGIIVDSELTTLKKQAIERNHAVYNSTNGHWQWK